MQFDFVVTHTYIVFAHPSSTSSPRAVGRRVCQNSVVGFRVRVMIIMKIEIVSDDGLMINVDGNGDIVGLRIIAR